MSTTRQNAYYHTMLWSLLALIVLGVAWEWVLAPLRPGGSWLILKIVPLLLPLRGILKRDVYTLQWSSMLILLYAMEGAVRVMSESGTSAWLAGLEITLSTLFFLSSLLYLKPIKTASKKRAKQALQQSTESKNE